MIATQVRSNRLPTVEVTPPRKAKKPRRSIEEIRQEYADLRRMFLKWFGKDEVDAAIRTNMAKLMVAKNKKQASPELWLEAIKKTTMPCDHCDGSGQYRWGACVNGKMTHSGPCFRCKGKGRMSAADCARTATYHNHLRVF